MAGIGLSTDEGDAQRQRAVIVGGLGTSADTGYFAIYTRDAGNTVEKVRVTSSGNVGIGTTGPTFKLAVKQSAARTGIGIIDDDSTNSWSFSFSNADNRMHVDYNAGDKAYISAGDGSWNGLSDARIKTNVADLPSSTLDKVLSLRPISFNFADNPDSQYKGIGFIAQEVDTLFPDVVLHPSSPDQYYALDYSKFGVLAIKAVQELAQRTKGLETTGQGDLTITGNVGIGTTSPGYTLTVSGTSWTTNNAWAGSDIRWKQNIVPLQSSLDKVMQLKPVNFDWRANEFPDLHFSNGTQIGFIAQDVEKALPEVVTTDNNGYKGISYERITPVLTGAIQELNSKDIDLNAKVTALEKENAGLKSENAGMLARIAALERK